MGIHSFSSKSFVVDGTVDDAITFTVGNGVNVSTITGDVADGTIGVVTDCVGLSIVGAQLVVSTIKIISEKRCVLWFL